jgi:hypothetical protein
MLSLPYCQAEEIKQEIKEMLVKDTVTKNCVIFRFIQSSGHCKTKQFQYQQQPLCRDIQGMMGGFRLSQWCS